MAKGIVYMVFLIPALAGIITGTAVLAQASDGGYLSGEYSPPEQDSGQLRISGLERTYAPSESIKVSVVVSDKAYECGDLYITVYDSDGKSILQNGYFEECFAQKGSMLPVSEKYSEKIGLKGKYAIEAKMYDRDRTGSIHAKETFYVR